MPSTGRTRPGLAGLLTQRHDKHQDSATEDLLHHSCHCKGAPTILIEADMATQLHHMQLHLQLRGTSRPWSHAATAAQKGRKLAGGAPLKEPMTSQSLPLSVQRH